MLHRASRSVKNLLSQRQFYLLLLLLSPLMYSLHWIAVRFPICYPDYLQRSIYEVEPDKLAVVFEVFGRNDRMGYVNDEPRAWMLDLELATLTPLDCPKEIGTAWSHPIAQGANGDLIFETKSGVVKCVGWDARTNATYSFGRPGEKPVLINQRYLACVASASDLDWEFVWCDLTEPNHPWHRVPIMETGGTIIPVEGTNSFYFVLPAERQDWLYQGMAMMGMGGESSDEVPPSDYSGEWINDDGSVEYELPPVVVNPDAPPSLATVVLMNLTEVGPKEVARWPVQELRISDINCRLNYITSPSVDSRFLETRDPRTGIIVTRVPIPYSALIARPGPSNGFPNYWSYSGNFVRFKDGLGLDVVFDCVSGSQLTSNPPAVGSWSNWVDQHNDEYLTWEIKINLNEWPGVLQVRSLNTHEVLHTWKVPDRDVTISSRPSGEVHFSVDGKSVLFITTDLRVLFVDKVTGKVVRHLQPRYWLPVHAVFLGLATLIWLICWIRLTIRSVVSLWVDELVLFSIALTFLYWRIYLSGNPYETLRLAWMCVGALSVAALILVVNQTLLRNVRLIYRCAPVIILAVAAIFGQWKWAVFRHSSELVDEVILFALVVICSSVVNFLFFKKSVASEAVVTVRHKFSLAELFAWTAIIALMLAPLNLYDREDWMRGVSSFWDVVSISILSTIVAIALSAYFLTAKPSFLLLRLAGASALAVLLGVSTAIRQGWIDPTINLTAPSVLETIHICEYALVMAGASVIVALPVGMRNARWQK